MAKFVFLPQHYNKPPVAVNVNKIYFAERSNQHPFGTTLSIDRTAYMEINMPVEDVVTLLNGGTLLTEEQELV